MIAAQPVRLSDHGQKADNRSMATNPTAIPKRLPATMAGALASGLCAAFGAAGALAGGLPGAGLAVLTVAVLVALLLKRFHRANEDRAPASAPLPAAPPLEDEDAPIPPDRIDRLTGLANDNGLHAWFGEKAPRFVADNMGIVVLSAELDDFEPLVRSRGQAIADAVLVEVAKRVAVFGGKAGIAARTGTNGEFAALATVVPANSEGIAAEYAGKLAEMIQRPVELPEGAIWIGGSVGAASGPASEGDGVLVRARAARERARRLGRGHYVVDNPAGR